jgi:hypothetical protein
MIEKTIKIKGNSYVLKYPTVGQTIDIKVMENQLAKGTLKDCLVNGLYDDIDAYLAIKTIAHVSVLIPALIKDLKVDNLLNIQFDDFQELVEVYNSEIFPWLEDWKKNFRKKQEENEK